MVVRSLTILLKNTTPNALIIIDRASSGTFIIMLYLDIDPASKDEIKALST